ncbi:glutamate receptor 2.7-like [Bidens hawaiensis]|uniref:glutamate receptor 2.7-like n=1 Tax=Bidens hawaiensis TaxID=980011 RepID=UPI00404937A9
MVITCHNMQIFVHMIISLLCLVHCKTNVEIGVILDMDTSIGKISNTCISMALHDFYQKHYSYTTVIRPHFKDSKQDNIEAASAAIDLLKNVQVMAIMGPTTSAQTDFVIDIGDKAKVPIISPATSPSLSLTDNLYFVRSAHDSTSQLKPIADVIEYYNWKEVVFVYEDDEYGRGLVPYLSDAMMNISTKVMYQTVIHPSASDDWIRSELYKLKTMQTRVFVVHALPDLASRFFKKVKETGMMEEGYVWITTEVITSRLHDLDRLAIESMQGVIGVKSYIPRSKELIGFENRWKREFRKQYPEDDPTELDMFGIWSYDAVFALARAVEEVRNEVNTTFKQVKRDSRELISDLDAIGASKMGPSLIRLIRNTPFKLKGLSGDFHIVDGQLQPSVYEIVNIIGKAEKSIGFWIPETGISKKLTKQTKDLKVVTWPGDTHVIPKGWEIPTNNANILRIGVPAKGGFVQFIDANTDPQTKQVVVKGFCVDVFDAVVGALPYAVKYEYMPFVTKDGKKPAGSYNNLIDNLSDGKYDAVVGDIMILADRSDHVDFTLPYAEAGVSLIVPVKDERKSPWIFMKPLEKELWITTGAFLIYIGLVVWVIEHRVNEEFRGTRDDQVGMLLWFSFSTLVYAHRATLISNLSRFVVIVWVLVVLVLTSSYTASLTSMLTVQQLRPSYTDIYEILRNGESVGYQEGSYVRDMLKGMNFTDDQLKVYSTFEEYDTALTLGSKQGGVSAIMDELPYIRVFLAKYCNNYTMAGPVYKTAGFGFAFTKGSSLVHDMSHAVLKVTEEQMLNISNQWFGPAASCDQQNGAKFKSDQLRLHSFTGLFLIAGLSSTLAFLIFFFRFLHQNREILRSQDSFSQKISAIVKTFDVFKDVKSRKSNPEAAVEVNNNNNSPAVSVFHQEAGMFSHDEGFYTTKPGTPFHDTMQALEITPNTP